MASTLTLKFFAMLPSTETLESTGVEGCSQGRNTQIRIGQVGIRCRHCAPIPNKSRPKGAVYYSKTVRGIYQVSLLVFEPMKLINWVSKLTHYPQTSQNMSKVHLFSCRNIPQDVRLRLQELYRTSRRATGGKRYWEDCLREQGVYEDGQMLRFKPLITGEGEGN